jgi:hypothetical protein
MQANFIIIIVITILFVAQITIVSGYQYQEDNEPRFRLRQLMEAMMDKRINIHFLI